jgi:gliding motility-associated-like protein
MEKHYLLCLALLGLVVVKAGAQTTGCGITVNAGPDRTLCFPGGSAQLNGSITGENLGFTWTPTTGMANPNSLQPSVFVNQTTTYTLNVQSYLPGNNLVANSDFSQGAVGFTSDYINNPNLIYLPGYYAIVTSPDLIYSQFPPCDDHSPGQGNMMIVDGSTNANDDIWCQTIPVTPNTLYAFGAWVGTIVPISVAQIQFLINGQPLGAPISAPLEVCAWTQFFQMWNSGTATSATICIRDLNTANLGNDFGLDDIFFAPVCTVSDPVTVTVVQPVATAPFVQFLPCSSGQLTLNAAGSSTGPGYSYQWTTPDGAIVSGANTLSPVVNEAGTYNLTVTFNGGGVTCTATATVIVTGDPATPIAFATPQGQLDCNTAAVTVSGAGSSQGSAYSYQWSTANGNISGSTTTQNIQVTAPGLYQLVVTNTSNGCTATATAQVNFNGVLPTVEAADSLALTCIQTQVELNGTGSSAGPGFQYLWTTTGGSFLSGETTLMPIVDQPGEYTLTVTNTTTGCEHSLTVMVLDQQEIPFLAIEPPQMINCLNPVVALDASASANQPGLNLEWSTTGGHFVSNLDSLIVFADAPGQYQLALSNPLTGCADTAAVVLIDGRVQPLITIENPGLLTCTDTLVPLIASDTTSSANTVYQWSSPGGALQGETDTLAATAVAAGWYYLEALDTLSGCSAIDSVWVQADTQAPVADAGADLTLDCNTSSLQLQVVVNAPSGAWSALWTSPDGLIVSGETTPNPIAGAPGSYILQAIDSLNGCAGLDTVVVVADDDLPLAIVAEPGAITCTQQAITLDASGSSQGPSIQYQWTTTNGNILSGAQTASPEVDAPGSYQLQVTDTANGCVANTMVEVQADTLAPLVYAGAAGVLTCAAPTLWLNGDTSQYDILTTGILWTSSAGIFQSDTDSIHALISAPGWYVLQLTNQENGCIGTDSVEVTADQGLPVAEAGPSLTLDCGQQEVLLDGSASTGSASVLVVWTDAQGVALPGIQVAVNQPGWYFLTATDTVNACSVVDSMLVKADFQAPVADAGPSEMLTCLSPTAALDGTQSSSGPGYEVQWTTTGGYIISGAGTYTPVVDGAGLYFIEITNTQNGCAATDSVEVTAELDLPFAEAGMAATLTCAQAQLNLDATASETGPELVYNWTTSGGNIVAGGEGLAPLVDAPGWYVLEIFNTTSGCAATDSVEVLLDNQPPVAALSVSGLLTCQQTMVEVTSQVSGGGGPYAYEWTAFPGQIGGPSDQASIQAMAAGTYSLQVTDQSNGCTGFAEATVQADTLAPQVQAGDNAFFPCNASVYTLQGLILNPLPTYIIQWSSTDGQILSGGNTLLPVVGAPGAYQLEVTNPLNGCGASDAVILLAQGIENVEISLTHPLCPGETGQIEIGVAEGGTAPYAYSVDGGQQYQSGVLFEGLLPGAFDVVVSDAQGCLYVQTVLLEAPYPVQVSLPAAIDLRLGETAVLSPLVNLPAAQLGWVKWEPSEGLSCSECLTPVVTASETKTYRVTVADLNGCTAAAEVTVYVDVSLSIYAPNIFSPNADGINDVFMLFSGKGQVDRILKFQVWSRWGDLVFDREEILPGISVQGWDGAMVGRPMPEGVYGWIVRVRFVNGVELTYHGDVTLMR